MSSRFDKGQGCPLRFTYEPKGSRRREKMMQDLVKVTSRVYFKHYRVHQYTDQSNFYYRFEDYAPYFSNVVDCIKWGRAYQDAERQMAEAQNKIAELKEESNNLLPYGVCWAEAK